MFMAAEPEVNVVPAICEYQQDDTAPATISMKSLGWSKSTPNRRGSYSITWYGYD